MFEKAIMKFIFWIFIKTRKNISDKNLKPRLFWGTTPVLNFKYWNEALKGEGFISRSMMFEYYGINKKNDFDGYFYEIVSPLYLRVFVYLKKVFPNLAKIHWVLYVAKNFDILHITYEGLIFKGDRFWKDELLFYKKIGLKIVALPYGGDYQQFSNLYSKSWQHVLLTSYPKNSFKEKIIKEKTEFLCENADCIMAGFQYDHLNRWDILPYAIYPMDCNLWKPKIAYNNGDGKNGVVKIYHTPNHKGAKGSEFLIEAVDELKKEGLRVELILLENLPNDKVKQLLFDEADILVEQLILGYALSAIEGMATGLPVITALEDEGYTRVFRRYSYLNECPMLSSNPEKIKQDLKILILNPDLRKKLGEAGRKYAEKYHSYNAMASIFTAIYDKIWFNKEVDLINFFNPQNNSSYNNRSEKISHPLFENKVPNELLQKLNK